MLVNSPLTYRKRQTMLYTMNELKHIYRYPVKGLSAESLSDTTLMVGRAIKKDRQYAIAPGSTPSDQNSGTWIAKNFFLMLARNPKLAQLETRFDEDSDTLTILRRGKQVTRGRLSEPIGRTMIEDFFAAFMGDEARGRPKIFEARDGNAHSDQSQTLISIINLASVRDLERITSCELDPIRFRGNLYFDGSEPWLESGWLGKVITIGSVHLKITAPVGRCVATHVNPETAERDVNILKALQSGFGHTNCGVFAEVVQAGEIRTGDAVTL